MHESRSNLCKIFLQFQTLFVFENEWREMYSLTLFMELENFVLANAQELAKDKWLCPLSGKKFRGPEFVKKHIFNKHADKVEGVKTEVWTDFISTLWKTLNHVLI